MDIMFKDLTPEAQNKVLEFLGITAAEEGNLDVFPLFTLENPTPEE